MAMKKVIHLTVKEMLIKRGFTQRDFAEATGIIYKTVGKLCTNKVKNPDLEVLARCCEVLRCDLSDIMHLVDAEGEYGTHIRHDRLVPRYTRSGRRVEEDV
jgi:DNA-binding Xre family transcriptional regulator